MHAKLMKSHGKVWRALSLAERDAYRARAEGHRDRVADEVLEHTRELVAEVDVLRLRVESDNMDGRQPLLMSSCRLSSAQITEFNSMWGAPAWSEANILELRALAAVPIEAPPQGHVDLLETMPIEAAVETLPACSWLSLLCLHREFYVPCIVKLTTPDRVALHRVCFAVQSP